MCKWAFILKKRLLFCRGYDTIPGESVKDTPRKSCAVCTILPTQPTPLTGTATPLPDCEFLPCSDPAHTPHGDGNFGVRLMKAPPDKTQPTPRKGTATLIYRLFFFAGFDPAHTPHGDGNSWRPVRPMRLAGRPSSHPSRGRQPHG